MHASPATVHSQQESQVAERLGNRAGNLKVAGLIPGRSKWRCVLGQGTSPYLPRGECPCTCCKSLWIRASAKWLNVNVRYNSFRGFCKQRVLLTESLLSGRSRGQGETRPYRRRFMFLNYLHRVPFQSQAIMNASTAQHTSQDASVAGCRSLNVSDDTAEMILKDYEIPTHTPATLCLWNHINLFRHHFQRVSKAAKYCITNWLLSRVNVVENDKIIRYNNRGGVMESSVLW